MSTPAFPQTIVLCLYGMVEKTTRTSTLLAVIMYTQGIYSHIHVKSAPTMAACMALLINVCSIQHTREVFRRHFPIQT